MSTITDYPSTPLYHGVSVRDAAMLVGVPEANVRKWLSRGILQRTGDGQICPFNLEDWYGNRRQEKLAKRSATATRNNPYAA